MFILIYGDDGTGKSVQCKNIAEIHDNPQHWSLALKNRRLYENSIVPSLELIQFNPDTTVNPYTTMDAYHKAVDAIVSENTTRLLIIDEISLMRTWAQPVVLEELNRVRRAKQQPLLTKIGEQNLAAWERVNSIVYADLERLANWAEINSAIVIAITSVTEKYRRESDNDGVVHSVATGEFEATAKQPIRKLADIRIKLEKNGRYGHGYYAIFEKTQEWMKEGKDAVKVDKNGLLNEFLARGVLK